MRGFLLIVFGFLLFTADAQAAAKVGEMIPIDLSLQNQSGEVQSFENLVGDKGVVLVFVRSADWCPYCQVQLLDLRGEDGKRITDLGYNIVTISYDTPELLKKFGDRYGFDHMMLSDTDSKTIKAFGILNETFAPDHFAYGVPNPHVYVVGRDKNIKAVLAEESYKKRPQVDAIVEAIEELKH